MSRVYRNISRPILILGLEILDILAVLILFGFVFLVSERILLNMGLVIGLYGLLRYFKKGRPAGYTMQLFRFVLSRPSWSVSLNDNLPRYLKR